MEAGGRVACRQPPLVLEVLLQSDGEFESVGVLRTETFPVGDDVVTGFGLEGCRSSGEELEPAEQHTAQLPIGVTDVVAILTGLQEVDPEPRANERMNGAPLPVVNQVSADPDLPQGSVRFELEFRVGPTETQTYARSGREIVFVITIETQRRLQLVAPRDEQADVAANRAGIGARHPALCLYHRRQCDQRESHE